MPGLKKNFLELSDSIEAFSEIPFSFLSPEKQNEVSDSLSVIFLKILTNLEKNGLEKTKFFNNVKILESAVEKGVDEQKFATNLKPFLDALGNANNNVSHKILFPVVDKFLTRILPFNISEIQAKKYRDSHNANEINIHDIEILKKDMQIYAVDYFLFAYKSILSSKNKNEIIFSKIDKAPALMVDAIYDDMLKKIVYSLYGKDVREKMISNYFIYKKVFLEKLNDKTINEQKISEITEALRLYCLSLIDVSLEYGIKSFSYSLLQPYKIGTDFLEIKKELTNVRQ